MGKTIYTANFSGGKKLTRASTKDYRGAYIVTVDNGTKIISSGFSKTLADAEKCGKKAMAYQMKGCGETVDGVFIKFKDRGISLETANTNQ